MAKVIIYTMNDGTYRICYPSKDITQDAAGRPLAGSALTQALTACAVASQPPGTSSFAIGDDAALPDAVTAYQLTLANAASNAKIKIQLAALDITKIRPLSDIAAGNGGQSITVDGTTTTPLAQLAAIEIQAAALRAQLV